MGDDNDLNTTNDSLPGDPGKIPSQTDKDEKKADDDRAKNEREEVRQREALNPGSGSDTLDLRDPPLTDNPHTVAPGNAVDNTSVRHGVGKAGSGASGFNADGTPSDGNDTFPDADDLPPAATTGPTLDADDDDEDAVAGKRGVDLAGVKRLGQEILDTVKANARGIKLTQDEQDVAARAANDLAYYSIATIGLTPEQSAKYAELAQRASTTLLNTAVGVSVDAKRVARDAIRQTIQRFFREALTLIASWTVKLG